MTVNLSINDLINKNYDTSKYNDIIDNGILSLEQVRALMIIKNVQDNRILLSVKEKEQLNNYLNKFSFNEVNDKDPNQQSDNNTQQSENNTQQLELVTVNEDSPEDSSESIKDPNLMTCPAPKIDKNIEPEVTSDGKKIYRIKYISDQTKLKMLAML